MKCKIIIFIYASIFLNSVVAQTDLIFKSGMEFVSRMNDSGITIGGNYPIGDNETCTSNVIAKQDCNIGRDVSHNDDSDGHAGFSFSKLDEKGIPLIDQNVPYEALQWTCVRDNVTGLVWEVKTTTMDIHNSNNTYKWGGVTAIGWNHPDRLGIYFEPSWNELVQGSNDNNFCGFNNWRVPTREELFNVFDFSRKNASLDVNYFPHSNMGVVWSSSPSSGSDGQGAWLVFYGGSSEVFFRNTINRVRLVSGNDN